MQDKAVEQAALIAVSLNAITAAVNKVASAKSPGLKELAVLAEVVAEHAELLGAAAKALRELAAIDGGAHG